MYLAVIYADISWITLVVPNARSLLSKSTDVSGRCHLCYCGLVRRAAFRAGEFSVFSQRTTHCTIVITWRSELNHVPATVRSLRFASENTQSAVLQTAIVHNLIHGLELDCSVLNETGLNSHIVIL